MEGSYSYFQKGAKIDCNNYRDVNTTYNNLVHNGNKSMTVYAGEEVKWMVKIIAHPKPNVTWYDQLINEVHNSSRRVIFVNKKQTSLKINNVGILDTGNYSLKSENDNGTTWKNFSLVVLDVPNVGIIDANSYYNQGQRYKIRCNVVGYPTPRIRWFIRYCWIPNECGKVDSYEIMNNYTQISYTNIEYNNTFWESTLNILAQDSGQLFCSASNKIGASSHLINFKVTDIGNEDQFSVWGPENPIEGDEVRLHCGGVVSNFSSDISWFRTEIHDKKEHTITNDTDFTVLNTSTYLSYQSTILIPNITKRYNGAYVCVVTKLEGYEEMKEINVHVQDLQAPFYIYTNMNETKWYRNSRTTLQWECWVGGTPQPVVTWYKNDLPLSKETLKGVGDIPRLEWSEGNQTLIIKFLDEADDGTYKCKAENKVGKVEKSVTLDVKGAGLSKGIIGGISIIIIACLVMVIYMGWRIKKERKLRKEMTLAGLINFEEGAMDNMNPELPLDEQAELLPYDKKWEFPRDKLKLGKQLGAGAFGVVMKAEAWGIVEGETVSTVAVKMVKKNADYTYLKALASELKIMVHLGKHLNVVNLLGASTKNLAKKELLVIVEFCRYGNLHNYLIRHRDHFIDQIDKKTGLMDSSIGSEILARAASLSAKAKIRYAALSFNNSGENSFGENARESPGYLTPRTPSLPPNSPGIEVDMAPISMTPAGEDSMMLSNNSTQPEWRSNVRGDYKTNNVRPICTRDLLCWAFQVARGMEYLVGRKVLHGDLAARNILLADDNIVKICDFGLAKSMYKSDNYQKKGDGPLPVKWMSVESIRDRIFSTQSDVWSFGIVLWEFFSLARTPYPGMEADEKLYNKLVDGYRMECPEYATKEVYKIMLECWQSRPTQRPSFTDLSETLGAMLEESVRNVTVGYHHSSGEWTVVDPGYICVTIQQHYMELNSPYMDMNMKQLEGHNDYLNMMSAPTYGNLVSPSYDENGHHYVNNPEEANRMAQEAAGGSSGYLVMKGSQPPVSDAVIFSPRTELISGNIFQFGAPSGHKKNQIMETQAASELRPILTNADESPIQINNLNNSNQGAAMMNDAEPMKEMKITNDMKLGTTSPGQTACFSNPNYQGPIPIKPSTDNYINMQQQKSEGNPKKYQEESSQEGLSSSNQNYLFMGEPGGVKKDKSSNSSQHINAFSKPNYQAKVPKGSETYVKYENTLIDIKQRLLKIIYNQTGMAQTSMSKVHPSVGIKLQKDQIADERDRVRLNGGTTYAMTPVTRALLICFVHYTCVSSGRMKTLEQTQVNPLERSWMSTKSRLTETLTVTSGTSVSQVASNYRFQGSEQSELFTSDQYTHYRRRRAGSWWLWYKAIDSHRTLPPLAGRLRWIWVIPALVAACSNALHSQLTYLWIHTFAEKQAQNRNGVT
uniref:Vascular endothelial growth factor receptor 1 n=1 Tax=Timema bartmani TaxID=61472 RepID=A0A7R9ELU0_9NEOP|nr:unnamed protein product [Timema bartmani]